MYAYAAISWLPAHRLGYHDTVWDNLVRNSCLFHLYHSMLPVYKATIHAFKSRNRRHIRIRDLVTTATSVRIFQEYLCIRATGTYRVCTYQHSGKALCILRNTEYNLETEHATMYA